MRSLVSYINELRNLLKGRVAILCHHNADPDAICAAYGLQELAKSLDPDIVTTIITPDGVSSLSRKIVREFNIETSGSTFIDEVDLIVAVDTATIGQLGPLGSAVASAAVPKIFIDHHNPHPMTATIASLQIVDESSSSTCEIIHKLYEALGITPSGMVARALLIGIAYDSRHFSIGTSQMLGSASKLLEIDGPLEEILSILISDRSRSERIARLKAAKRMNLYEIHGWTVATSRLSSFQASAARALIRLGADVSIVVGRDKGELRASLRASDRFYRETGVHLGSDLARILGDEFEGAGSGHPTAAGMNGRGDADAFQKRAVDLLASELVK